MSVGNWGDCAYVVFKVIISQFAEGGETEAKLLAFF